MPLLCIQGLELGSIYGQFYFKLLNLILTDLTEFTSGSQTITPGMGIFSYLLFNIHHAAIHCSTYIGRLKLEIILVPTIHSMNLNSMWKVLCVLLKCYTQHL